MSNIRIPSELHTHTTASDGEHTPAELAQLCADHQIAYWSLTDHDTCAGCEAAACAAASHGITFIPGVEITAYEDRSIHVLGYGMRTDDEALVAFFDLRRQERQARMDEMIERARALNLPVTHQQVAKIANGANMTRPHLAQALVAAGEVETIHEAFDRYLAEGMALYVPHQEITVAECAEQIHQAGGLAFLAHPGIYHMDDHIPRWVHEGQLDGIEVGHPRHSVEKVEQYTKMCQQLGVMASHSSDFHGLSVHADRQLGQVFLSQQWLDDFLQALA